MFLRQVGPDSLPKPDIISGFVGGPMAKSYIKSEIPISVRGISDISPEIAMDCQATPG
ncbi:hypothetical protein JCM10599A_64270 [Paraburkholderia kururiensis]